MALSPIQHVWAQHEVGDSSNVRSANALAAQMARLIKEHAYFNGVTGVFRYEAYADTTRGLKLYVGRQFSSLGSPSATDWFYIDFEQPIRADELRVEGKKGNFTIDAAKRITKKIGRTTSDGQPQERNARLFIMFLAGKKKRTVDFEQLQAQLFHIVSRLIQYQKTKRISDGSE